MKTMYFSSVLLLFLATFTFSETMAQGGSIKIFQSGDIVIGGLSVGGFGLNMQPNGYIYLNTQIYSAWSWANTINANHNQQACNMVSKDGVCNSWDLGDGTRWARKTYLVGADYQQLVNISNLDNPLETILSLQGRSYQFTDDIAPSIPDTIEIINKDGSQKPYLQNDDSWSDTSHYSRMTLDQVRRELSWNHYGLIAQEVQKFLPEAVRTMPDSTLAIEYNAIIPYLIEAIKELNRRLEKINSDSKENSIFKSSKEDQNVFHTSKLFQNQPNPFNKETVIKYEIDDDNAVAKMLIFNIQGTLLKSYSLNKSGEIRIKQSEFQPGMYLYSLIQDGLEIDTKRFILTQDN